MTSRHFLLDIDWYATHFDRLLITIFASGFGLFIASAFTGRGGDLIGGDAAYYFEYARSVVIDGHLPTTHIKYPCGVSLIGAVGYAPMVFLARGLMAAGLLAPSPRWNAGWALPEQIAFCIPFLVLSLIAFRANVAMFVRLGYSRRIAGPMILFWIIATNVGFYVLKEPAMSESGTYAFLSFYYWALIRWFYRTPEEERAQLLTSVSFVELAGQAAIVGVFLGFGGMFRQQNILHSIALPILVSIRSSSLVNRGRRSDLAARFGVVAVAGLVSAMLFVIPWAAWYVADHRVIFFSYGNEHFDFASPHLLDSLFHVGYHGLFVWHPAFALAGVGLVPFLRSHRQLAPVWLAPFAVQAYLIVSWHFLSYGASVGGRGWFSTFPLLLAGFVATGDWCVRAGRSRMLLLTLIVLTVGNAVVTLLLMTGRLNPLGIQPQ